jgi:putative endopeptidase
MAPHEVNAYYHPLRNEIVFPAGILQPPFFDATADDPINYGGIGAVIGHEITHGFDDMGSRFDASGNFANWWSEEDRAEFERRADVLVDQYDGYRVVGDLPVNGRLTLGENIADLGGLTIAFEALRVAIGDMVGPLIGRLTPAQRFFLSFARVWRSNETDEYLRLNVQTDPHSPPMFRCNGALGNLDEFARAFDLDDDDPMMRAPNVRAKVW